MQRHSSGIFAMLANASNMISGGSFAGSVPRQKRSVKPAARRFVPSLLLRLVLVTNDRRRLALDQLARSAGALDLLLGASREGLRAHGELLRQRAVSEDLEAVVLALDEALGAKRLLVDGLPIFL